MLQCTTDENEQVFEWIMHAVIIICSGTIRITSCAPIRVLGCHLYGVVCGVRAGPVCSGPTATVPRSGVQGRGGPPGPHPNKAARYLRGHCDHQGLARQAPIATAVRGHVPEWGPSRSRRKRGAGSAKLGGHRQVAQGEGQLAARTKGIDLRGGELGGPGPLAGTGGGRGSISLRARSRRARGGDHVTRPHRLISARG